MGLFDLFKKKKGIVDVSEKDSKQFAKDMEANAQALIKQFADVASLDFSVDSLQLLDKIIEDNTTFYKQADKETQRIMIVKIGAYIFEVARLNFGGRYCWYGDLSQPILVTGEPEFKMALLAFDKTKGRFEKGAEDNIPFFFEGYVQGVKNKANQLII